MTKSFFLLLCYLSASLVLSEEQPQKGGAEQIPGNKQQCWLVLHIY